MLHVKTISYEKVTQETFAKVNAFIWEQCQFHYGDKIMPERYEVLRKRIELEMSRPECCAIFSAFNEKEEVIGVIALSDYDDRIDAIKGRYPKGTTAEMSRCYVHASYRRAGIGARLFELATTFAKTKGYEMLYLHTHYFLPGGFLFWSAMGFTITLDEGGVWQTVHMERVLENSARSYA